MPARSLCLATPLLLAGSASAQDVLHEFTGSFSIEEFGQSIDFVEDLDGDGIGDLLVGGPNADHVFNNGGAVYLLSGATGAEIVRLDGLADKERLGACVRACGDVDLDGTPDFLACGERDADRNGPSGFVRVFSGADYAILHEFDQDHDWSRFGFAADGAGDVNGDGHADIVVGAPDDDWVGPGSGSAFVYSGADGSQLHVFRGVEPWSQCGFSVCGIGDLDFDGCDDFAVGSRLENARGSDSGAVRVYSGRTGVQLWLKKGEKEDSFGYALDGGKDVDGDGFPDWIAGGMNDRNDSGGEKEGMCRVFTGFFGTEIFYLETGEVVDGFGASVALLDDVDGDGHADFMIGSPFAGVVFQSGVAAGRADVYSGVSGRSLYQVCGAETSDHLGLAVGGAGDLDGDGFGDFAVGAPGSGPEGGVTVFRSDTRPSLAVSNLVSGQTATFESAGGQPGASVYFNYSLTGYGVGEAFNFSFDIQEPIAQIGFATADAAGTAVLDRPIPSGTVGTQVWMQAYEIPVGAASLLSNAITATVQ